MLDKKKVAAFVSAHNQPPKIPVKKPPTPKAEPVAAKESPAKKAPPPADAEHEESIEALAEEAAQAAEASSDPDIEDVLVDYDEKDTSPPKWAEDKDLWDEAVSAIGLGTDDEDRYDEPYAVVAYLYKKLGGKIAPHDESKESADEEEGEDESDGDGEGKDLEGLVDEVAKESEKNPDPELMKHLENYDPVRDGNPPSWVTDEALWERAKEAVDPEGKGASYDEPYAVIAHVYKKMGGKVT